jgi:hypothetical protein
MKPTAAKRVALMFYGSLGALEGDYIAHAGAGRRSLGGIRVSFTAIESCCRRSGLRAKATGVHRFRYSEEC